MKTAECQINLEVMVDCPYCEHYQDVLGEVNEGVHDMFEEASRDRNLDIEVTCKGCKEVFELKRIYY